MNCRKCHKEIPLPEAVFCPWCGAKQAITNSTRRGNGQGCAYKDGKTWTCVVTLGQKTGGDGKHKPLRRKRRGFRTKAEALAYAPALRNMGKIVKGIVTLDELYSAWSASAMLKLSKSKQTAYKIAKNKIEDILFQDISQLTISDLQQSVNANSASYYTAKDIKNLLSHLYTRAAAQGDVPTNLANFIELPELNAKEQKPFSDDEQTKIWEDYAAGNTFTGYILLMIYTGMMPGELLDCRKDMVYLDAQTIEGAGKKTKKRRETPIVLSEIILPVAEHLLKYSSGHKLLTMNKDDFYKQYHDTLKRIGVRDLPPYSCRHTTATALAKENINPAVIQQVMRHSKITTTQGYIHIDIAHMLEAVNHLHGGKKEVGKGTPQNPPPAEKI